MDSRVATIRRTLEAVLSPVRLEIEDQSAQHAGHAGVRGHGGGHFAVLIVAGCFAGKSRIARHRMVHDALGDAFRHEIHALSIRAEAPEECSG
ncbi:MAG: BolA family transcriptional regulator [Zetaproteobacteria bacterium CG06_land_8_20_14_3_00_59_53]|nr:MAG: BolA family transcriptional regulator [Zetaproteobacteria bacterium CG2_30_59_37]PIO89069.1 MAG: BolA family transcriptional regulator [Zetaproteobacteria bacterium CG23_combo_of_CG06-09_8_20_14_all_59_86]PIQ65723.1 MAG: BolA family transcriptional regulator [Zetaproteobacteria bacterium CG11_big_fil_rev_8_21_14_0_20_59_439]PIU70245.1 MAG: BolA family transcriptional regulator [Zetaproteobacteria bacterium CG06_land_8_20_14_3_00_59_53]PIU96543.1 MAG: BolA family transcriptional regulato